MCFYIQIQGRITATTTKPNITVGVYDWATVKDIKPGLGAFLDIGIKKDMLLGEEDLPALKNVWPEIGDSLFITLRVNKNNRIYVKLATDPIMEENPKRQQVMILIKVFKVIFIGQPKWEAGFSLMMDIEASFMNHRE